MSEDLEDVIESMAAEIDSLRGEIEDLRWERDELEGRVMDYEYGDCDNCFKIESDMLKIAKKIHKEIHRDKGEAYHYQNCLAFPCADFHAKGVK